MGSVLCGNQFEAASDVIRSVQSELAKRSGVALRQIQLFEQRQRDINHTRAIDVLSLAREIGCKSEELLEI